MGMLLPQALVIMCVYTSHMESSHCIPNMYVTQAF